MKVLTDTHSIFWAINSPELLSKKAEKALLDPDELHVSVVNFWEMILKRDRPGALVADPCAWWEKFITKEGFLTLSIIPAHVKALGQLSKHHGDPFDRMLIAQCKSEGFALVTKDKRLATYGVPIIW